MQAQPPLRLQSGPCQPWLHWCYATAEEEGEEDEEEGACVPELVQQALQRASAAVLPHVPAAAARAAYGSGGSRRARASLDRTGSGGSEGTSPQGGPSPVPSSFAPGAGASYPPVYPSPASVPKLQVSATALGTRDGGGAAQGTGAWRVGCSLFWNRLLFFQMRGLLKTGAQSRKGKELGCTAGRAGGRCRVQGVVVLLDEDRCGIVGGAGSNQSVGKRWSRCNCRCGCDWRGDIGGTQSKGGGGGLASHEKCRRAWQAEVVLHTAYKQGFWSRR